MNKASRMMLPALDPMPGACCRCPEWHVLLAANVMRSRMTL
jgi:hypothetical protein